MKKASGFKKLLSVLLATALFCIGLPASNVSAATVTMMDENFSGSTIPAQFGTFFDPSAKSIDTATGVGDSRSLKFYNPANDSDQLYIKLDELSGGSDWRTKDITISFDIKISPANGNPVSQLGVHLHKAFDPWSAQVIHNGINLNINEWTHITETFNVANLYPTAGTTDPFEIAFGVWAGDHVCTQFWFDNIKITYAGDTTPPPGDPTTLMDEHFSGGTIPSPFGTFFDPSAKSIDTTTGVGDSRSLKFYNPTSDSDQLYIKLDELSGGSGWRTKDITISFDIKISPANGNPVSQLGVHLHTGFDPWSAQVIQNGINLNINEWTHITETFNVADLYPATYATGSFEIAFGVWAGEHVCTQFWFDNIKITCDGDSPPPPPPGGSGALMDENFSGGTIPAQFGSIYNDTTKRSIDTTTGIGDLRSLMFYNPTYASDQLYIKLDELASGSDWRTKDITVSFDVKIKPANNQSVSSFGLSLLTNYSGSSSQLIKGDIFLSLNQWAHVSVTFNVKSLYPGTYATAPFELAFGAWVGTGISTQYWFDNFNITYGDSGVGATGNFATYATMTMPGQSCIAFKGDASQVVVHLSNTNRQKVANGLAKFTLTSVYGGVTHTDVPFDETASGSNTDIPLTVDTSTLGYWTVQVEILLNGQSLGTGTGVYEVVNKPQGYDTLEPNNFFGVMGVRDSLAARRIGVKHDRASLYWRYVQSVQNGQIVYNWQEFDNYINNDLSNNVSIDLLIQPEIYVYGTTVQGPNYNITSGYDIITNPQLMTDYKNFIRAAVQRYKNKVVSIEVVNEPDVDMLWGGNMTVSQMGIVTARLMEEAYAIIKQEAPNMPVLGMSVSQRNYFSGTPDNKSITDWIFAGSTGKTMLNKFSIHPYPEPWTISGDPNSYKTPEQYNLYGLLSGGIGYMKNHGIQEAQVTEIGYAVDRNDTMLSPSRKTQAALLPRQFIISKSFPEITRALCYSLQGSDTDTFVLVAGGTANGASYPYLATATYAECAYMLYNTTPTRTIKNGSGGTASAYQFQSPTKTIVAAWYDNNTKAITINGIPSLKVYDVYGNLVGSGNYTGFLSGSLLYFAADLSESNNLAGKF